MAKFVLYKDSALTQVAATIPVGSATGHTDRSGTPGFSPTAIPDTDIKYVNVSPSSGNPHYFSMTGVTCSAVVPDISAEYVNTTLYFEGGTLTVRYRGSDTLTRVDAATLSGTTIYGRGSANSGLSAALYTYGSEQYIVIMCGAYSDGVAASPCAVFTVNAIGKKSWKTAYDDESRGLNDGDGNSWGGTGDKDRSTDNVGIPPFINGITPFNRTGGHGQHVYILDGTAYDAFTGYLWGRTQSVFGDLWQKWENLKFNPIAAVLACHCLPTAFIPLGDDVNVIEMAGTDVSPMPALTQAVRPSGGHIIQYPASGIPNYLDMSALIDFTDFTGVSIVLHVPFCGSCTVSPSACMGGVGSDGEYHAGGIGIVYRCDILTGNVCAFVMCRDRNGNTACVQTLTGNCAYTLPVTGNDNGAGVMLGALTSTAIGAMTGNAGAVVSGIIDAAAARHHTTIIGNHGGSAAVLTNLYCWAEITYNEYSRPANTDTTRGRPADIGGTVAESDGVAYQGYTVYDAVDVHGIDCTAEEREMIEQALLQGVYV